MKRIGLLLLGVAASAFAAPDYTLLQNFIGAKALLKWDGAYKEGVVTVVASDSGVGFSTAPLDLGSNPVPAYSEITNSSITTLSASGTTVTQTAQIGVDAITITYVMNDGYYTIEVQDCTSATCKQTEVIATTGKAPGDVVTPTPFLQSLAGSYVMDLVAGAPPETSDAKGEVDTTNTPTEASLYFPYCTPSGCDLGYIGLQYTSTQIFHENLGTGHDMYTIFKYSSTNQLLYYNWEVNNGSITFRNPQYSLSGKTVCLEHVMHKGS